MLKIKHHYPKKILLISFECANWTNARSWPYNGFYAFEEALGNHAEVLTIPAIMGVPENDPCSWLGQAKRLTEGEQYDQAWIWVTHNDYSPEFLKWLQTKAPVQVGVIMESLAHTAFEETNYLHLKSRREKVLGHIRHCTHVLAFDDKDAHALQQEIKAKVFWCPPVVRWCDVNDKIDSPNPQPACFQGALYSQERQAYLKYEPLKKLLQRPKPLEDATDLPNLFDIHQAKGRHQLKHLQLLQ